MRLALLALLSFLVDVLVVKAAPLRLSISGSKLLDPSGDSIRLTGFNWVYEHLHAGDGALMKKTIPGSNVARVVGLLWDNLDDKQHECYMDVSPYFKESCFDALDNMVRQATDAGVWVILTCRAKYAAAYEIMSEPRDKEASAQVVHDFYADGCAAVHLVDPVTPCMVGPRSYYKLYAFTDDIFLANDSNVIYAFDYFDPDDYVFGRDKIPMYPAAYHCHDLYEGWTSDACPGAKYHQNISFDATWHEYNFATWVTTFKEKHPAPIFMNQWGVVHGVTANQGRFKYMQDVAKLAQDLDIGWAWWTFRGGGGDDWSHGSMEFLFQRSNGTLVVDQQAVTAVQPYMGGKPGTMEISV